MWTWTILYKVELSSYGFPVEAILAKKRERFEAGSLRSISHAIRRPPHTSRAPGRGVARAVLTQSSPDLYNSLASSTCVPLLMPPMAGWGYPHHQVSKVGFETFARLRQNVLIPLLTGLAPDAQLRLVPMFMGQIPGPRIMPRSGVNRCVGILCVHTVQLIRSDPAPLDGNPVIVPFAQFGGIVLSGDAGVHDNRGFVLALIPCCKAVQRFEKRAGFADIARQNTGSAWKTTLIFGQSQRDQGTIVALLPGTSEPGQSGRRSFGHVVVGQVMENYRAGSAEQLALAGKKASSMAWWR